VATYIRTMLKEQCHGQAGHVLRIGSFVAALLGLLIVLYVHNRFARLGSVDQSHADVRQLEQKLAVALEDRSKLQREIAAMKRDVEQTWAAERIESALLRERTSGRYLLMQPW
jgi:septal ring factor EnvC (AmiA/AmiB activator)